MEKIGLKIGEEFMVRGHKTKDYFDLDSAGLKVSQELVKVCFERIFQTKKKNI